jgi:hypothetical protein
MVYMYSPKGKTAEKNGNSVDDYTVPKGTYYINGMIIWRMKS